MDAKYNGIDAQARARVKSLPLTSLSGLALGESVAQTGLPFGMLLKAENLVLRGLSTAVQRADHSAQGLKSYNPPTDVSQEISFR